jgi:hypothetical protein
MTPEQVAKTLIADLTACRLCRYGDAHEVCAVDWHALEHWIVSVEARLRARD